jgi:hypothetical protein
MGDNGSEFGFASLQVSMNRHVCYCLDDRIYHAAASLLFGASKRVDRGEREVWWANQVRKVEGASTRECLLRNALVTAFGFVSF